jgi:hypothetical protein
LHWSSCLFTLLVFFFFAGPAFFSSPSLLPFFPFQSLEPPNPRISQLAAYLRACSPLSGWNLNLSAGHYCRPIEHSKQGKNQNKIPRQKETDISREEQEEEEEEAEEDSEEQKRDRTIARREQQQRRQREADRL